MTIAPPAEILIFLKKAYDGFLSLAKEIRFDKQHTQSRNVIALYASIMELTKSCILLLDNKLITGVPVLLRSIFEAYIDLVNLIQDENYSDSLQLKTLKEWLKILEEAKIGDNDYLVDITTRISLAENIAKVKNEIKNLKEKNYKLLTLEKKFTLAGMKQEYKTIYNSLSSDSHNDLSALIKRHISFEDIDFHVVFYKEYTLEDSAHYVWSSAEILVQATVILHQFLKSSVLNKVLFFREELNKLRGDF